MLLASPIPNQFSRYPQIPPMLPNAAPPAPGYFHPQFAHQPNRPMPLPFRAASCCDDCSCGSSGGCPDCTTSGRGSLSMAGFFSGLGGLGISSSDAQDQCNAAFVANNLVPDVTGFENCMRQNGFNPDGSTYGGGSSSGSGSGSGSNNNNSEGGFTSFISNLATNLVKPGIKPGTNIPQPWYTTPVGLGALVIGGVALYMLVKK